jgi:hypothetical protein
MSIPIRRGPRALSEILGELFTVRGYGRLQARQELEEAWNVALGEPYCRQTRLGEVRRGVLNVTVAHPTLLEELAAFRKPALLAALRSGAPATAIHDIRFRIGLISPEAESKRGVASRAEEANSAGQPVPAPPKRPKGKRGQGRGYDPAQP